jgi:hypothetical protein
MQPEWNLRYGRLLVLALCSFLFVYLILALTEIGSGAGCHWAFPRWFGCVLGLHETLAAGLMGAAGVLIAAWMAWTAVQQQINADRERTVADRKEAERLLAEDLTNYADGMAAAWRELLAVPNPTPESSAWESIRHATAYMAERLSRSDRISNYRAMAEILGWDRRRKYAALIKGLENFDKFRDPESIKEPDDVLNVIRNVADDFENCLPDTSGFFVGLWRRPHKAMSFADYIRRIAQQRF